MMNFKQSNFFNFLKFLNNEYKCDEEIEIIFIDEYFNDLVKVDIINKRFTIYTKFRDYDYKNFFYKIAFKYILLCQIVERNPDKMPDLICDADDYASQIVEKYFLKNI